MRKGQLRMQLMSNEKARRRQFEKRKTSLQKAATDLSTLCGVDIGMIVFGPPQSKDDSAEQQPTISNQQVLAGLIEAYKARPCHDSRTKTYSLSDFYKEKTEKIEGELDKLRRNKLNFKSPEESKQFHDGLMAKKDAVWRRINVMKGSTTTPIFPNSYYNPVQGISHEQQQPQFQRNFVYYSDGSNTYYYDNNNNPMMGYYGGGASNGMYMFDDQKNYASYGGSASNGTYGMMMMMESVANTNAKPLMSYNDQMMAAGYCYVPPQKSEQNPLALDSPNPDGSGQISNPAKWFLKEES